MLVRPLKSEDDEAFAALCARDPYRYLTPRLNLEVFGFESAEVRPWGAFEAEGALRGVLLRYSNTILITDDDGATASWFTPLVDAEEGLAGVRGSAEAVSRLRSELRRYTATGLEASTFLCLFRPPNCPEELLQRARRAGLDDLDPLTHLYAGANAMYRSRANIATKLADSRVFVVEETSPGKPRRIVACALLNIEGGAAGLIGGVYTLPAARGRGFASACTAALSLDLQRDGKTPCLFYENPVAGRVYRRLGFEEKAHWSLLYIRK